MSIKKQLQKFYAKQGLQGKHLRKAIQWDMKAVASEIKRKQAEDRSFFRHPHNLMGLHWGSMPEPTRFYWAKRHVCAM